MKSTFFIVCFLAVSSVLSAQSRNLTCLDFAKGEFINVGEGDGSLDSTILRKGKKQVEMGNGVNSHKKIQWLNDCDYVLSFDRKEAKQVPFKSFINKMGGITVTMDKIEGDTFYYKTSYFDGQKNVLGSGKMTKVKDEASL